MRFLMLFLVMSFSVVPVRGGEKVEVGEWVEFKNSMVVGPQTIQMTQKYAIVGEEKDDAGNQLMWFETNINMPGNPILTKVLIPAKAFEEEKISSAGFFKQAKRWIVKMGAQPAMELPVEQALQQMKGLLGLGEDPQEKVTELGEEELETAKGKIKCQKKQHQGKTSMEQAQGPIVMTIHNTYDRVIWHSDGVPIVGYAKMEDNSVVEVKTAMAIPGAPAQPPQKVHSQMELVGFGKGATSVLTEDPVQMPVPNPGP